MIPQDLFPQVSLCRGGYRDRKNHDSQRRDRILRFFFSARDRAIVSLHFGAISLLNYTENLGKEAKKSTGEVQKNPVKLQLSIPYRG